MAKKSKKVILFIVEGPTDEDALSPVLKQVFENDNVHFHIVYGDITTDNLVNEHEIKKAVWQHIKQEMDRYGFKKKDLLKIIHLLDTDGAFIPSECVIYSDKEKLVYTEELIQCENTEKIIERNRKKRIAVQILCSTPELGGLPYSALYFSRNLEHALHGKIENLSSDEKIELADGFADLFEHDIEAFKDFLKNSCFTVHGSYGETWDYIMSGTNSLKRKSNFHLVLDEAVV